MRASPSLPPGRGADPRSAPLVRDPDGSVRARVDARPQVGKVADLMVGAAQGPSASPGVRRSPVGPGRLFPARSWSAAAETTRGCAVRTMWSGPGRADVATRLPPPKGTRFLKRLRKLGVRIGGRRRGRVLEPAPHRPAVPGLHQAGRHAHQANRHRPGAPGAGGLALLVAQQVGAIVIAEGVETAEASRRCGTPAFGTRGGSTSGIRSRCRPPTPPAGSRAPSEAGYRCRTGSAEPPTWRRSHRLIGCEWRKNSTTRSLARAVPSQAPAGHSCHVIRPLKRRSSMRG